MFRQKFAVMGSIFRDCFTAFLPIDKECLILEKVYDGIHQNCANTV